MEKYKVKEEKKFIGGSEKEKENKQEMREGKREKKSEKSKW